MLIGSVITHLESIAPAAYQESWDNAGLLSGDPSWECTGILVTLDVTENVTKEAIEKKCNLIVAHHPIIFGGIKQLSNTNYVGKTLISAIKNDIAIYAIHTNLDNVIEGVNGRFADKLGLVNRRVLSPASGTLKKLYTFTPPSHSEQVRKAVFQAGAGYIGNYSEVCFTSPGLGTYKAGAGSNPFAGTLGKNHEEPEIKLEVIFPAYLESAVVKALVENHPYEEVAYDIIQLSNKSRSIGSGLLGELPIPLEETAFLALIRQSFGLQVIRHTALSKGLVKTCAICGGAGSFLISKALAAGADFFISSDIKYHEFFEANDRLVIADIGHFETEQFTIDLLHDILREKFTTFAVQKSTVATNPVHYFL